MQSGVPQSMVNSSDILCLHSGTQEDCRDMREGVGTRHGSANADYENGCALRKGRSVDNPIDEAGREGEAKARKGPEGRGWG